MQLSLVIVTARRLEYAMQQLWDKVKALIAESITPEHREVVECYDYIEGTTNLTNEPEGQLWLDFDNDVLYETLAGGQYQTVTPDPNAIYVRKSSDDSIKLLVWHDGMWIYASEQAQNDNSTLIISDLSELDEVTTPGIYNVTHVTQLATQSPITGVTISRGSTSTTYTLYVSQSTIGVRRTLTQSLINQMGYKLRSTTGSSGTIWRDWESHDYSFTGHTHTMSDVTGLEAELTKIRKMAAAGL